MDSDTKPIVTRQQLIENAAAAWQHFVAYVDQLSDAQWDDPRDAAGWSVKDHVAHVSRWDRAAIALLQDGIPFQQSLDITDAAWTSDSYDPLNEEIRQPTLTTSVASLKAERDATWSDLVALLAQLDDAFLASPGAATGLAIGNRPVTQSVGVVLDDYLAHHYHEHLEHIKTFA
jgi:hypothetical protein